jgi:hypothetical protein
VQSGRVPAQTAKKMKLDRAVPAYVLRPFSKPRAGWPGVAVHGPAGGFHQTLIGATMG